MCVTPFKRLFIRKRPCNEQSPRCLISFFGLFSKPADSCVVLQAAVSAFTFSFAGLFNNELFTVIEADEDAVLPVWVPVLSGLLMYFLVCFLKVNVGACYPSDCLFSLVPTALVFLLFAATYLVSQSVNFCE